MRAEILTIGTRLCRGEMSTPTLPTSRRKLWDLGITTRLDDQLLRRGTRHRPGRDHGRGSGADIVLCSGGLGPTEDDLTVDVLAGLVAAGR